MTNKPIDKIVLTVVVLLLVCVAVLNICQTERPTVSVTENRNLATMPEFSVSALLSGEYFAGISDFISDTFLSRDAMVAVSKKIDTLKSLSLIHAREGISVIVDPNPGHEEGPLELTLPTFPPLPTVPQSTEAPPETTEESTEAPTEELTEPPTEATTEAPTVEPTEEPTEAPTEEPTEAPTVEPTVPDETAPVTPITLSTDSASFTAGASCVITATVGEGYENLRWVVTGDSGVTVTDNGNNTATVTGDAAGSAVVTATVTRTGETYSAQCQITVNAVVIEVPQAKPVDFLPNGMIIYDGAAHSQSYFSQECATGYAKLYDLYAQLFPKSRMSVVIGPLSTITITDPAVTQHISDQGAILDQMQAAVTGNVNFVNLKNVFLEHAKEYLFFRSDHHWTHRGAYYAYSEFIKSVGMTPVPIDTFEKKILNDGYIGSMYNYTGDDRVGRFFDTVEAYSPTKACTMKIFFSDGSCSETDTCIMKGYSTYVAFICGDNPYTVINVPENPQDKSVLVIKDSFGNAFVTYLTEHYGNIVVIDPRHADMNLHSFYDNYQFDDIVFVVNSSSANTQAWYDYLASLLS